MSKAKSESELIEELVRKKRAGTATPEELELLRDLTKKHVVGAACGIVISIITVVTIYLAVKGAV